MTRCIYCLRYHHDTYHGPRSCWDWHEMAKDHEANCVWVRTKGETGMPMEKQAMLCQDPHAALALGGKS